MILFVIVVGYGNRHPWYQLPFVPICAAFAGNFCGMAQRTMPRRRFVPAAIALTIIFGSLVYPALKLFYRESASDLRDLGLELKRSTPPDRLSSQRIGAIRRYFIMRNAGAGIFSRRAAYTTATQMTLRTP